MSNIEDMLSGLSYKINLSSEEEHEGSLVGKGALFHSGSSLTRSIRI